MLRKSAPLFLSMLCLALMKQSSGFQSPIAAVRSTRTILSTTMQPTAADQAAKLLNANLAASQQGPSLPPLSPTAKRMFFVRHGEVINPGGDRPVYYGAMDVPLSKLGEQEAIAAGLYLSQFQLAHVFSSPLSRAVFGAKEVAKLQKKQAETDLVVLEGFKELDRGDWCGKTKEEIGEKAMAAFDACDLSVTPANGESFPALKRRVLEALHTALGQMKEGQSACLVSHLQVTRSILSEALGVPTEKMTTLPVATASVTCIDYETKEIDPQITVHFQSYKPEAGLAQSIDLAN